MKIKTITCHDVYNVGASLQAYALQTYLTKMGHDVEIIDYKPDYLSHHYRLTHVPNPKYDRPIVREAYILAKLPGRIKALRSKRKTKFDLFTLSYLKKTRRYNSYQELVKDPPKADVYFAGSDQIWNPLFPNGKDPAFYLQFVKSKAIKASYAASFAVDIIEGENFRRIKSFIENLDYVSVREKSALNILETMNLEGYAVCDPVFLLKKEIWEKLAVIPKDKNFEFIYDFDDSNLLKSLASIIKGQTEDLIISAFPNTCCDKVAVDMGPLEFLGMILNANTVISNSFHATAFALIFHKNFYVIRRTEGINRRMEDLLSEVGLSDRIIGSISDLEYCCEIDWNSVDEHINYKILKSQEFIERVINYGG